jgi:hypothetical protein
LFFSWPQDPFPRDRSERPGFTIETDAVETGANGFFPDSSPRHHLAAELVGDFEIPIICHVIPGRREAASPEFMDHRPMGIDSRQEPAHRNDEGKEIRGNPFVS